MADNNNNNNDNKHHGLGGGWVFLIVVIIILLLAFAGWTLYTRLRARRLGLPAPPLNPFARSGSSSRASFPSPAPGGILGWVNDRVRALKNRRYASGAGYEGTSLSTGVGGGGGGVGGRGGGRGHARLDPDEAWDSRVGGEADLYGAAAGPGGGYYEEQELGLHAPTAYHSTTYGGGATSPGLHLDEEEEEEVRGLAGAGSRGRSRQRELDERYDEEMGRRDPFADEAAERSDMSLRGVSPRPIDTGAATGKPGHQRQKSGLSTQGQDDSPSERRSMFRENM